MLGTGLAGIGRLDVMGPTDVGGTMPATLDRYRRLADFAYGRNAHEGTWNDSAFNALPATRTFFAEPIQ